VLVLRYLEDMSERDVAEALGVTVGTVRSTAHAPWPSSAPGRRA
jgi:DNA-directed RNA polymerase specialized sigma24 family protein